MGASLGPRSGKRGERERRRSTETGPLESRGWVRRSLPCSGPVRDTTPRSEATSRRHAESPPRGPVFVSPSTSTVMQKERQPHQNESKGAALTGASGKDAEGPSSGPLDRCDTPVCRPSPPRGYGGLKTRGDGRGPCCRRTRRTRCGDPAVRSHERRWGSRSECAPRGRRSRSGGTARGTHAKRSDQRPSWTPRRDSFESPAPHEGVPARRIVRVLVPDVYGVDELGNGGPVCPCLVVTLAWRRAPLTGRSSFEATVQRRAPARKCAWGRTHA